MPSLLLPAVEKLLTAIRRHPGLTFSELHRTGKMPMYSAPQLSEWLVMLVRFHRVVERTEGPDAEARYYTQDAVIADPPVAPPPQPTVKIRPPPLKRGPNSKMQQRILQSITGETSIAEIAERTGLTPKQICNSAYFLKRKGLIELARYGVYTTTDNAGKAHG